MLEQMMKNKKITAIVAAVVVLLVLIIGLRSCGKNNSYAGYYIMDKKNAVGDYYALQIKKDGTAAYSSSRMNWTCSEGYVEKGDDCVLLYFNKHMDPEGYVEKYCPLYVRLSDDGKRMYLSSDNQSWQTDTFEVVNKKTYEEFAEAHSLTTSINK